MRSRRRALALGAHPDPFAVLGPHDTPDGRVVRAFLPGAVNVDVLRRADRDVIASLQPGSEPGLFENLVPATGALSAANRLAGRNAGNRGPLFIRRAARRS